MNARNSSKCPESNVLIDFLQGRLTPPALDQCETHIADCTRCHETLRDLNPGDTLSEKVAEALVEEEDSLVPTASEPAKPNQLASLIDRLTSPDFAIANSTPLSPMPEPSPAESEMLADRAAEVLRCVAHADDDADRSLGKLADYQLLRLIGAGSTGVVFQARDIPLDRIVALKVLRPSLGELARQRFLAEARSAASIEHTNVITIFQVGQFDRLAFIAMQWQPGQTLEVRLRSGQRFDEQAICQVIQQVAAGLEAAHQKQTVHRDIKPANIWLCDESIA